MRLAVVALAAALALGCDSEPSDPTLRSVALSPDAAAGAAVVELTGAVVVSADSDEGQVFFSSRGDTTRVVLLREVPGPLRFTVRVEDPGRTPVGTVVQVADAQNRLADASTYRVAVNP